MNALDLMLVGGVVVITLVVMRPAPQPTIIYMPVEVAEARGGLGCLPLIVGVVLVLLALGVVRI